MSELPKTGQPKTYTPTPEQLERWKRLDEDDGAIAGRMPPEEQQAQMVKEFLDIDFTVADQLEKARIYKEKLLQKVKSIEEYEQFLLKKQQERKQKQS
jgi:hypothetical protein